jgi:DNA-binding NtrC family response regulator
MKSILLIDDERPTLEMFSLLLQAMGYETRIADNAAEGLELFKQERPSVVFTDVKMPGMNGLELLSRMKEIDPDAEIVVVTGHGDLELALESLDRGAADFIDKPLREEALKQALDRANARLRSRTCAPEQPLLVELPEVTRIDVSARLCASSEPAFETASARAVERGAPVLVRLDTGASLSAAGVALLTQLLAQCREARIPTSVAVSSASQRRILEAAGVSKAAPLFAAESEALAALAAASPAPGGSHD